MAPVTVPPVTIGTTSDGTGYPHGLVTGTAATPELAVADLTRAARMTVGQLLASLPEDVNYAGTDGWAVEVIDTRLTTGPTPGLDRGWVAYGTLRTAGLSPLIPPEQPFRG